VIAHPTKPRAVITERPTIHRFTLEAGHGRYGVITYETTDRAALYRTVRGLEDTLVKARFDLWDSLNDAEKADAVRRS
jgi:hypothetical protein